MTTFSIKQNDTRPALQATLTDADGTAINLTGASARFHMTRGSTTKVDAVASIVTPASGIVRYIWQTGDTDTVGVYSAEMEITYSDGGVETFPNSDDWVITITPELA